MDQLRTALTWLKKYHFWVLSVVVVGVAVGCWYTAAGTLSQEYQSSQSKIKTEFESQARITRESFHANEAVNQAQEEQTQKQADYVRETWEALYQRQQDKTLNWPQEFDETFLQTIERLKFEDPIRRDLREQYYNYIKNYFPKLPAIVHARVLEPNERGGQTGRMTFGAEAFAPPMGGRNGTGEDTQDDDYLVDWLDQAKVRQELEWPRVPSALQIWVTQEDLWVYSTLLHIVADTNEGATRRSNAKVRQIIALDVGRIAGEASKSSGRIHIPDTSATDSRYGRGGGMEGMMESPGMGGADGGMSPGYTRGGVEGMGGLGGAGDSDERAALLSGRYLSADGQPIPVAGAPTGPQEFGVEYKRLPIRMELLMDQRAIPELIANCANQPLQVEVQQVQINPSGARNNTGRSPAGFGGAAGALETFDAQPNLATVVIHGIIYILNEPNTAALQVAGT